MCGLLAYAGKGDAFPFLENGLRKLEYRGYDSHGYVLAKDGKMTRWVRRLGEVDNWREERFEGDTAFGLQGSVGLAHTRWATNGVVSLDNTHPVAGTRKQAFRGSEELQLPLVYLVHNGKVDNANELRDYLMSKGYAFQGQTDSEVIAHFLADEVTAFPAYETCSDYLVSVASQVIAQLKGANAFVFWVEGQDAIFAATSGLPLVVSREGHIASDAAAFSGFARDYLRLDWGEVAMVHPTLKVRLCRHRREVKLVEFPLTVPDVVASSKSFPDHMRQEIEEQKNALPYYPMDRPGIKARACLFGCGSSYHAALVGQDYLQSIAGIPTRVEYATEMFDRPMLEAEDTTFIALTQSGETRDVLLGMERVLVNQQKPMVLTTNEHSTASSLGTYLPLGAGEEVGVAATKTFTAQLVRLLQIAASETGEDSFLRMVESLTDSLWGDSGLVSQVIEQESLIQMVATGAIKFRSHLFLGRGNLLPIAMEGALKMKEVSYIHAEAIHASELKHGPLALIDDDTLSIVLVAHENSYVSERVVGNVREILARGGRVVTFTDDRSYRELKSLDLQSVVRIPTCHKHLQPIVMAVAVQLFAYHCAVQLGRNVDRPRSIAKCVTVE